MALRTAPIRLLWLLWLLAPAASNAQVYEISGESSLSGTITLTVYDGDTTTHTYKDKITRGLFYFTGVAKKPVAASITHPSMKRPLFFYLEGSEIGITLNASRPEASHITGSRSNSEYRYVLERYRSDPDPAIYLRKYVGSHTSSIYAPFILHQLMSDIDEEMLRQLFTQLDGEACDTYHYRLLDRWMKETPAVAEGVEMPDFEYYDSGRKRCRFSATRSREGATLLFFGAKWCDLCKDKQNKAAKAAKAAKAKFIVVNIDDYSTGWDEPCLKSLSIDHLPFMILVNREGLITARDPRVWELDKLLQ